jgi:hypothetical protein
MLLEDQFVLSVLMENILLQAMQTLKVLARVAPLESTLLPQSASGAESETACMNGNGGFYSSADGVSTCSVCQPGSVSPTVGVIRNCDNCDYNIPTLEYQNLAEQNSCKKCNPINCIKFKKYVACTRVSDRQ